MGRVFLTLSRFFLLLFIVAPEVLAQVNNIIQTPQSALGNSGIEPATYFLDATNGNDNTAQVNRPNKPWQSFNGVMTASTPGSIIKIRGGSYFWPATIFLKTNQFLYGSGTNATFLYWTNTLCGLVIAPGSELRDCTCVATNAIGSSWFIGSITNFGFLGGSLRVFNSSFFCNNGGVNSACIALGCHTNTSTIEVYNSRLVANRAITFTIQSVQGVAQKNSYNANTATFWNCYSDGDFCGAISGFSNVLACYSCTFTNSTALAANSTPNYCIESVWNVMTLANCIINQSAGTSDVHVHSGILNLLNTPVNGARIFTSFPSAINPGASQIQLPNNNSSAPDSIDVTKYTAPNARGGIIWGQATNRFLIHNGYYFSSLYGPPINTNKIQIVASGDATYIGIYTFSNTIVEGIYPEAVYTNGSTPGKFLIYCPFANEDFGVPSGTTIGPFATWQTSSLPSGTNSVGTVDSTQSTINDINGWGSGTQAQVVPLEPSFYLSTNSLDAKVALNGSWAGLAPGIFCIKTNGIWRSLSLTFSN